MRRCVGIVFGVLLSLSAAQAAYLELTDFHLIDGTGAPPRDVNRLIAKDGVIVAIDDEGSVPPDHADEPWTRIGLRGAWVIPGLIDTHVHVARFPDARERAQRILHAALRGGVTSVRDLAGDARALAELERGLSAGEWQGPSLVFSALLGGPDMFREGPSRELAAGRSAGEAAWARAVTSRSDLAQVIAQASGSGAGNIKLYADMSPALTTAIIREARRQGLSTTAHATVFTAAPRDLVDAGVGTLSHAPYLVWAGADTVPADFRARTAGPWATIAPDHPRLLALYRRMAERGVFLDATLYVYQAMHELSPMPDTAWAEQAYRWGAQATRLAQAAGVRVTTGTDAFEPRDEGGLPHTHDEMALLVEAAGFTPMQAIVAATRNGAAAIGRESTYGSVQLGKHADLVVLDANPLDDIHNTTRIRLTFKHGVPIAPDR